MSSTTPTEASRTSKVGKPGRPGREPADEVEGRHGVTVEEDQHVAFTDGCTQVARRPGAEPEVRLAHDQG